MHIVKLSSALSVVRLIHMYGNPYRFENDVSCLETLYSPRRKFGLSILILTTNCMANTYTQIHIQGVFAVAYRHCVIQDHWKNNLYGYITGIIEKNNHKLLVVNGMPDHLHVLFGMRPSQSLSDLLQDIKGSSSKWINEQGFIKSKFSWQEGYGAFSYRKSDLPGLIHYINNQQQHHQKTTFLQEYESLLKEFEVLYDPRYLFKEME
jgi:putative transposase